MIRINLLKAEAKAPIIEEARVKGKKLPVSPSLALGLVLVIIAAVGIFQTNSINKERRLLSAAQDEKSKLGDVEAKLTKVEAQKTVIMKKINLISELKSFQEVALRIMDEISKTIPDWVWLEEVTCDNKKQIQIKGKALSNKLIADYISNLEASPTFEKVDLISSIQQTRGSERILEFLLTTNYVPPAPVNPPPKGTTGQETK
jgi:type IV pilus assembly protein PilN